MNIIQPVVLRRVTPHDTPGSVTRAMRGLAYGLRTVALPLVVWLVVCMGLGISLYAGVTPAWLEEAAELTLVTLWEASLGFGGFLLIFGLLQVLSTGLLAQAATQRPGAVGMVVAILGSLVVLNSLPIVIYIDVMRAYHSPSSDMACLTTKVFALLMANAMLYHFVYTSFVELSQESKEKLYMLSVPFKAATPRNYLREKVLWIVRSSLSPLFYYLFSFTLFTNWTLQADCSSRSIVGTLFRFVIQGEWQLWQFWIYFGSMAAIVLPLRYFLFDLPLHYWERQRNLGEDVS